MNTKETARQRAELIMKVRAGQLSVKEAAAQLGVSRKTYYEWEAKGLTAMLRHLEDQEAGRPVEAPSPEIKAMQEKIAALEQKLAVASQTAEIRAVLLAMEKSAAKKKRPKSKQ